MITLSNISASNTNTNYTDPATALQIVGQVPRPAYARQLRISPNGITFTNGQNTVAIPLADAWLAAVTYGDVGLSYAPYVTTDPSDASATAPAPAAFAILLNSEITPSYQWQCSNNNGATWTNISGAPYGGENTNTLNVANTTGLNNYLYRCYANNELGNVTSANARLTVV